MLLFAGLSCSLMLIRAHDQQGPEAAAYAVCVSGAAGIAPGRKPYVQYYPQP